MKKNIIIISVLLISFFSFVLRPQAISTNVTYGVVFDTRSNANGSQSNFATYTGMPVYPIASLNSRTATSGYDLKSMTFVFNSPTSATGISYTATATFRLSYTSTASGLKSGIQAGISNKVITADIRFQQGTVKSATDNISILGSGNGYIDLKITSVVILNSTTDLSTMRVALGGGGLFHCASGDNICTNMNIQLSNLDVTVTVSQDLNNTLLNGINQNQQETNNKLDDLNNSITDPTPPDTSEFGEVSGWLPAGPVDSILTLPLNVLNTISNVLSGECNAVTLPLPFIDKDIQLTCGTEFYSHITGLTLFLNTLFTVLGGVLLYKYFVYLYNWIDRIISMEEQDIKDWGGV